MTTPAAARDGRRSRTHVPDGRRPGGRRRTTVTTRSLDARSLSSPERCVPIDLDLDLDGVMRNDAGMADDHAGVPDEQSNEQAADHGTGPEDVHASGVPSVEPSAPTGPEGTGAGTSKPSGSAKKGSATSPLTYTPKAVVLDTSLWGEGTLDLGRVTAHAARLGKSGIELWIPEQVMLEWASHAAADAAAVTPAWGRLKRAGLVSGGFPVSVDVADAVASVHEALTKISNVTVLAMTGDAAVAGIRDQILGTGPGEVRKGTKTGAVDSSWVRDAIAAAGGDASQIVFVTWNAKDVHATAKAMGTTAVVRSEHHLYSALFGATKAPEFLVKLVTQYVDALALGAQPSDDPHDFAGESLLPIPDVVLDPDAYDPPYPVEVTDVALASGSSVIGLIGVESIGAFEGAEKSSDYTATLEFQVLVLTDLDVVGYYLNADGEVVPVSAIVHSAVVRAPLVADVEDLHVVTGSAGPAVAGSADPRFDTAPEALEWLLGEISALHGVSLLDDDLDAEEFEFLGTNGTSVHAIREGSVHEDWTVTFDLGSELVMLTCRYDPDVHVWAGKDSFDIQPPYYVFAGDGETTNASPYAAIGTVWRSLMAW